jgi:protein-disulfide isomerase
VKWNSDRQNSNLKAAVALARQRALALGASGTPSFFVNGRLLGGLQSAQRIKRVIEAEISKAQKLLADGVPRKQIVQKLTRLNNANFARLFYDGQAPRAATAGQAKVSQTVWKIPVRDHNPQRGPKDALVTLVEFADFECPYCAKQHVVLSRLLSRFPKSLRVVFKNSPQNFHKNALPAAHAGAYAQSRGRFWAFAERVFAHQGKLDNQALVQHAQAIGLDGKQAEGAINRQAFAKEILGDQADAASVAAVGTPNLFINGRKVVGYRNADILAALISEEVGKAKSMIEEGTAARELYNTIIARGKERQPLSQKRGSFSAFGRPTKGPENAPIQLTVFADFQCPFSRNLVPILARVNQAFDGKVHTLFKHFPQSFHKSARSAARVAVCAHEQERFWDFHNALFDAQRQRHMEAGDLRKYASEVGLNTKKLNACLGSKRPDSILEQDLAEAKGAGVKGTPSIFLNGRLFNSPTGYNDRSLTRVFSQILNAAGN